MYEHFDYDGGEVLDVREKAFERMIRVILWRMKIPAETKTALERVADGLDI